METLKISLPKSTKNFVDSQVAEGGYRSASDFVRNLIEERKRNRARGKVDALLREGLESSRATPMTPRDWDDIRREIRQRRESWKRRRAAPFKSYLRRSATT